MDVFKTLPGINESIPITNENYVQATKKPGRTAQKRRMAL